MQIMPITKLRDTTEISQLCHQNQEPIFLTKNGYGDMVVMAMETYRRTMAKEEIVRKLAEAEADVEAGRVCDAQEVFDFLKRKNAEYLERENDECI
jgi:PHD/YefM family antitoxin component YafN of YafNO toxin-antitoxin module